MAGLNVKTAATTEALTNIQIRDYLRVDQDSELGVLQQLRKAAREFCEQYTGRVLLTQTLELYLDATDSDDPLWEGVRIGPYLNFHKNYITLPSTPVVSVTHIKTYDDNDVATTMAASKYYVDTVREPARITLRTGETWPSALRVANAIQIEYVAGYANAGLIPSALQMGMLQHMAYMYDQRGDMKDFQQTNSFPPMLAKLYQPYKVLNGFGGSKFMGLG
tara:strand:+ start:5953 stop:6612 length:660 start_codon:yes stop_codon:yes gene_type:complete